MNPLPIRETEPTLPPRQSTAFVLRAWPLLKLGGVALVHLKQVPERQFNGLESALLHVLSNHPGAPSA